MREPANPLHAGTDLPADPDSTVRAGPSAGTASAAGLAAAAGLNAVTGLDAVTGTDASGAADSAGPRQQRIDVVTIFPDYLAPLELSLVGKARQADLLDLHVWDLREFTHDRHRTVDDTPYGGGAGMVMRPEPWGEALDAVLTAGAHPTGTHAAGPDTAAAGDVEGWTPTTPVLIVPSPAGYRFTQAVASELAECPWLILACGRYEGIDERVIEDAASRMPVRVLSLGDYVLAGGEVAALAMIEAVTRLVPGVLGNERSLLEESHADGLLEYPVYTKPPQWRGRTVPAVLTSGNHAGIERWRQHERLERTRQRRPDLLSASALVEASQVRITLATPADAQELLVLQRSCWIEEARRNDMWDMPALVETLDDVRAGLAQWQTYVVRDSGRLIGSVRARLEADTWHIARLMVAPDLWGIGLGRRLLEVVEQAAPQQAVFAQLYTGAHSTETIRMYRRAGYRIVTVAEPLAGATYLRKRLAAR